MLPGEDGYSILEQLKLKGYQKIPVIMVTAKEAEFDKVRGLEAGAMTISQTFWDDGVCGKGKSGPAPLFQTGGRQRTETEI